MHVTKGVLFAQIGWNNFMAFIIAFVFFLAATVVTYYTRQDPERTAERFKWKNIYLLGNSRSWEIKFKWAPIIFGAMTAFSLVGAMTVFLILIF